MVAIAGARIPTARDGRLSASPRYSVCTSSHCSCPGVARRCNRRRIRSAARTGQGAGFALSAGIALASFIPLAIVNLQATAQSEIGISWAATPYTLQAYRHQVGLQYRRDVYGCGACHQAVGDCARSAARDRRRTRSSMRFGVGAAATIGAARPRALGVHVAALIAADMSSALIMKRSRVIKSRPGSASNSPSRSH